MRRRITQPNRAVMRRRDHFLPRRIDQNCADRGFARRSGRAGLVEREAHHLFVKSGKCSGFAHSGGHVAGARGKVHSPCAMNAPAKPKRPAAKPAGEAENTNDFNEETASSAWGEGERIAKALARAGIASRRDVERLIAEGRVTLNGQKLTTPACKVTQSDVVLVDGRLVPPPEPARMWRYHKPPGLLTTNRDPAGRPTIFERLPETLPRVVTIGRLDFNSEGLLLLTNDGAIARRLELPAFAWVRRYRARAFGDTDQSLLDQLAAGVSIDGVHYGPIEARLDRIQGANAWLTVSIKEGKNREVRRVLEHVGLKVNRLIRTAFGPFQLGDLAAGAVEEVPPRVLRDFVGEKLAPKPARRKKAASY